MLVGPIAAIPFDLALMAWTSPAFPIGSFAYSHGLEWAIEAGDVVDADTLASWLEDLLAHGSIRSDVVLLTEAFRVATDYDSQRMRDVAELAVALSPSCERRLETCAQGKALLTAACAAWPCPTLELLTRSICGDFAHPVAFGALAAGHAFGVPGALHKSCAAFAFGFVGNLVSAAVRLGPIGQTEGQRLLSHLSGRVDALAHFAFGSSLDDLGSCIFRADIASMRHETQYSRLFRS